MIVMGISFKGVFVTRKIVFIASTQNYQKFYYYSILKIRIYSITIVTKNLANFMRQSTITSVCCFINLSQSRELMFPESLTNRSNTLGH